MVRRLLTAKNQPVVLGLLLVFDLLANVVAPKELVAANHDRIGVAPTLRPWLNPLKASSVVGLLLGLRSRTLGAVTAAATVGYFVCAFGYHRRARDSAVLTAPSVLYGGVAVRALLAFLRGA